MTRNFLFIGVYSMKAGKDYIVLGFNHGSCNCFRKTDCLCFIKSHKNTFSQKNGVVLYSSRGKG